MFKNSKKFVALVACVFTLAACEAKRGGADDAQAQITVANQSLDRMAAIEDELRARGLMIRHPEYAGFRISNANEAELSNFRQRLEEYVVHGQAALRISNRTDVSFRERVALEKRVVNVQMILEKVKSRLRTIAGLGGPAPTFWARWNECSDSQTRNLEIHGFRFLQYTTNDFIRLQSMTVRQRAEIAARVQSYIECDSVIREGRRNMYGDPYANYKAGLEKQKSTTSKAEAPTDAKGQRAAAMATDQTAPTEIVSLKKLLATLPNE